MWTTMSTVQVTWAIRQPRAENPSGSISQASVTGHGTNVIQGLAVSLEACALPTLAIVAAIITPTIDPVNQVLMMAPMIALYFLSILFSYIARPPKKVEG
jgi:Na+/H+-translocating membrane pyrophosphatase